MTSSKLEIRGKFGGSLLRDVCSVLTIPNPRAINVIGFFMNQPLADN
jgi:hypothetical protein